MIRSNFDDDGDGCITMVTDGDDDGDDNIGGDDGCCSVEDQRSQHQSSSQPRTA